MASVYPHGGILVSEKILQDMSGSMEEEISEPSGQRLNFEFMTRLVGLAQARPES